MINTNEDITANHGYSNYTPAFYCLIGMNIQKSSFNELTWFFSNQIDLETDDNVRKENENDHKSMYT